MADMFQGQDCCRESSQGGHLPMDRLAVPSDNGWQHPYADMTPYHANCTRCFEASGVSVENMGWLKTFSGTSAACI